MCAGFLGVARLRGHARLERRVLGLLLGSRRNSPRSSLPSVRARLGANGGIGHTVRRWRWRGGCVAWTKTGWVVQTPLVVSRDLSCGHCAYQCRARRPSHGRNLGLGWGNCVCGSGSGPGGQMPPWEVKRLVPGRSRRHAHAARQSASGGGFGDGEVGALGGLRKGSRLSPDRSRPRRR